MTPGSREASLAKLPTTYKRNHEQRYKRHRKATQQQQDEGRVLALYDGQPAPESCPTRRSREGYV